MRPRIRRMANRSHRPQGRLIQVVPEATAFVRSFSRLPSARNWLEIAFHRIFGSCVYIRAATQAEYINGDDRIEANPNTELYPLYTRCGREASEI